jgi:hypothetical protein
MKICKDYKKKGDGFMKLPKIFLGSTLSLEHQTKIQLNIFDNGETCSPQVRILPNAGVTNSLRGPSTVAAVGFATDCLYSIGRYLVKCRGVNSPECTTLYHNVWMSCIKTGVFTALAVPSWIVSELDLKK